MQKFKDLIKSDVGILCDTIEKADFLSNELNKLGYKWSDGSLYTERCYYELLNSIPCYCPNRGNAASNAYYERLCYKIISLETIFPKWNIYISQKQISKIISNETRKLY